jgi:hypothetical protein
MFHGGTEVELAISIPKTETSNTAKEIEKHHPKFLNSLEFIKRL